MCAKILVSLKKYSWLNRQIEYVGEFQNFLKKCLNLK